MRWMICLLLFSMLLTGCDELRELYGIEPSNNIVYVPMDEILIDEPTDDIVDDNPNKEYCESKNMSLGKQYSGGFVCTPDDVKLEESVEDEWVVELEELDNDVVGLEPIDKVAERTEVEDEDSFRYLIPTITGIFIFMLLFITIERGGRG